MSALGATHPMDEYNMQQAKLSCGQTPRRRDERTAESVTGAVLNQITNDFRIVGFEGLDRIGLGSNQDSGWKIAGEYFTNPEFQASVDSVVAHLLRVFPIQE